MQFFFVPLKLFGLKYHGNTIETFPPERAAMVVSGLTEAILTNEILNILYIFVFNVNLKIKFSNLTICSLLR